LLVASSLGSVLLGLVLARVVLWALIRVDHPATAVLLQFSTRWSPS
jgi:NhaP-type Na+/H+ or K+/H+ antiporter